MLNYIQRMDKQVRNSARSALESMGYDVDRLYKLMRDKENKKETFEATAVSSAIRDTWIKKYGADVIGEAESYYETDFGKDFWRDLYDVDRLEYIADAKRALNK